MQISPGDAQASGCQRLVPIVFPDGGCRQFDFIFAELPLKRACGMVVANIDNAVDVGEVDIVLLDIHAQIFSANRLSRSEDDRPLDHVLQFTHIAGPAVALKQNHGIGLQIVHRLLKQLPILFQKMPG